MKLSGISHPKGIIFFSTNHVAMVTQTEIKVIKNKMNKLYLFYILLLIDIIPFVRSYHSTGQVSNSGVASIVAASPNVLLILFNIVIWGIYLIVLIKYGNSIRKYHGAEHKVIAATENNDLENANSYSRIHDRCGTNLLPLYIVLAGLTGFNFVGIPMIIAYILFNKVTAIRNISIRIGRQLQSVTTKEPTDKELYMAMKGMNKLLQAEGI